jgi:hypothetical protein
VTHFVERDRIALGPLTRLDGATISKSAKLHLERGRVFDGVALGGNRTPGFEHDVRNPCCVNSTFGGPSAGHARSDNNRIVVVGAPRLHQWRTHEARTGAAPS